MVTGLAEEIVGGGNVPSVLTDLRDVGGYVAKIIIDDRTLNRMVLAYNTVMTQSQIYEVISPHTHVTFEFHPVNWYMRHW